MKIEGTTMAKELERMAAYAQEIKREQVFYRPSQHAIYVERNWNRLVKAMPRIW